MPSRRSRRRFPRNVSINQNYTRRDCGRTRLPESRVCLSDIGVFIKSLSFHSMCLAYWLSVRIIGTEFCFPKVIKTIRAQLQQINIIKRVTYRFRIKTVTAFVVNYKS